MNRSLVFVGTAMVALGAVVGVACGSSSDAGGDLLAADAASEASSTGSTGSSGGVDGASPDAANPTTPRPADDAGVTADGGVDPADAGPGGDTATISCGSTTCPLATESCCVSEVTGNGDNAYACVLGATCPTPVGGGKTASLKCSGAANCGAGTVCCVREVQGNAESECKATCAQNEAQLCDPSAVDAGCPAAAPCSSDNIGDWGELPRPYGTCGGQGN